MKDIFEGKNEIRKFDVKNLFFKKFSNSLNTEEENYFQLNKVQFTVQFCAWVCAVLASVIPMGIGLLMVVNHFGGVEIGTIVTLTLTADHVLGGVREIVGYQTQISSTKSIRDIGIEEDKNSVQASKVGENSLTLKDVAFDRGDKEIFQNVNLQLKNSDKVIINGDSGVGKSTLLNIISGQLKPTKGKVEFGNRSIALGDSILVSQKSWLFAGNVADNLSLYENFSDEEMEEVLKKVHLWDELGDKPLQFKIESEGSNLSGGQAQRLTIARGLLRHKRLFLLDEITSSLDKENSHAIRKLIYTLPIMTVEVAHNIDAELVKQYGIEIRKLTKNGLS